MLMLILCFSIASVVHSTAIYASQEIRIILDGEDLSFDVPPQIIDDRTMVPIRAIFEALEMTVEWREDDRSIEAAQDDFRILMSIGNYTMEVGTLGVYIAGPGGRPGRAFNLHRNHLDVPPLIVNGRTLVPLRAIAESLGAVVDWDSNAGTVTIETFSSPYPLFFNTRYSDDWVETLHNLNFDAHVELTEEQKNIIFSDFGRNIFGNIFYLSNGEYIEIEAGTIGVSAIRIVSEELASRFASNSLVFQAPPQISYVYGVEVLACDFAARFTLGENTYLVITSELIIANESQRQAFLTEIVNRLILGGPVDLSVVD